MWSRREGPVFKITILFSVFFLRIRICTLTRSHEPPPPPYFVMQTRFHGNPTFCSHVHAAYSQNHVSQHEQTWLFLSFLTLLLLVLLWATAVKFVRPRWSTYQSLAWLRFVSTADHGRRADVDRKGILVMDGKLSFSIGNTFLAGKLIKLKQQHARTKKKKKKKVEYITPNQTELTGDIRMWAHEKVFKREETMRATTSRIQTLCFLLL